jgi:hypothetical protein
MNNLSPKMEKRYNMIVSNLRKAKSEEDTDRIYSNHIVLLPKKVKKKCVSPHWNKKPRPKR